MSIFIFAICLGVCFLLIPSFLLLAFIDSGSIKESESGISEVRNGVFDYDICLVETALEQAARVTKDSTMLEKLRALCQVEEILTLKNSFQYRGETRVLTYRNKVVEADELYDTTEKYSDEVYEYLEKAEKLHKKLVAMLRPELKAAFLQVLSLRYPSLFAMMFGENSSEAPEVQEFQKSYNLKKEGLNGHSAR